MSNSKITTLYKGEFVMVDMVDLRVDEYGEACGYVDSTEENENE